MRKKKEEAEEYLFNSPMARDESERGDENEWENYWPEQFFLFTLKCERLERTRERFTDSSVCFLLLLSIPSILVFLCDHLSRYKAKTQSRNVYLTRIKLLKRKREGERVGQIIINNYCSL